jgi:hypothetical protein
MVAYKRSEVTEINIYGIWGKGPSILNIAEVVFTNGSLIKVPGLLIDEMRLIAHLNSPKVARFPTKKDFVPAISSFANVPTGLVRVMFWGSRTRNVPGAKN